MFRVGVITTTHGVHGGVKVFPTTSDPQRFLTLDKVYFSQHPEEEKALVLYHVEKVQFFKDMVILKLKELQSMNESLLLKGGSLWIDDADAMPLADDEFYMRDFLDARILLEDGAEIGVLEDILETGANNVFVVRRTDGGELLIPVIKDCVLEMNLEEHFVRIHLLPGLEEL